MKLMLTLTMVAVLVVIIGCNVPKKKSAFELSDEERKQLCETKTYEISDDLRKRLIANSKELKLTPEEMLVLKKTGKVILCGDCGYILNTEKFHKSKKTAHANIKDEDNSGFADDSIRDRIIGPYTN